VIVSDIEISSAIDQHPRYGPMTPSTCHLQRSLSMIVSDIEINSAVDQHLYMLIALCTCVMQETCI
jgi:hypothetical protein